MSDLDNAINSINASAAKAEKTATFLDDMSTFDNQSSVTNPNNGQTVASIPKQVKDRTDELFTAAESDINQAVADAEQSATDAQDAADSIGRYQGLWPDFGGSANKGDTYQTQVSGMPTGQYFTALQSTTVDPVGDDINWREVVSGSSVGLQEVTATGSSTPRRLDDRFADVVNVKDFGADPTGATDSSQSFVDAWGSNSRNVVIPDGMFKISSDITLDNSKIVIIRGIIAPDAGVVVSLNAEIDAGHYQIFGGEGKVLPTWNNNGIPVEHRSKTRVVKAAWFGVVADAYQPGNYATSRPNANFGDLPEGTDNTQAVKYAGEFVQYGSVHAQKYLTGESRMTLQFQPNSNILVKGDGIFGEQAFRSEMDEVYSLADSGQPFYTDSNYLAVDKRDYHLEIDGNNSTIFWQPLNATDEFFRIGFLINSFICKKMVVVPCGFTTNGMGVLFHNRSATQFNPDGSFGDWQNSLGWPTFEDFDLTVGELLPPQNGTFNPDVAIDKAFWFTGYGRGDRLNVKNSRFTQFNTFYLNENPESVEHNFDTGCSIRSLVNGAAWFHFTSFYGQFKIQSSGIFLKGENQTVLKTEIIDNRSKFSYEAEMAITDCRVEGGNNRHTLLDMERGKALLSGFNHGLSMTSETERLACNMIIKDQAKVYAESCTLPGVINFIDYDDFISGNSTAITLNNTTLSGSDGLDKVNYTEGSTTTGYARAIVNGWKIPTVAFNNPPTTFGADVIPACSTYGGLQGFGGEVKEAVLRAEDNVINGSVFYLPAFCVVEDILISRQSMDTAVWENLRIIVGSGAGTITSDYAFPSNDGQYMQSLLQPTDFLVIPGGSKSERKIEFLFTDSSFTQVTGGSESWITVKYRSILTNSECPNSGLQTTPAIISL